MGHLYSKFSKILVKFSVFDVLHPYRCTDSSEIRPVGVDHLKIAL